MAVDEPRVAESVVTGTFQGETWINVFHFTRKDAVPIGSGDCAAINTLLVSTGSDARSLKKLYTPMDAGLVLSKVKTTSLSEAAPLTAEVTTSIAGTSVGNDYPAMTAVVAKWSTGLASKRFQGRTYISGLNVGFVQVADPDRFDSAWAVSRAADYAAFAAGWVADATYDFVVFSRTYAEENPGDVSWAQVIAASVNPLVCIQRRRRPRS